MSAGSSGGRMSVVLGFSACCLTVGCSEGRWFPDVDGPPKGEQWMYYSPNNTDPSLWPPSPSIEEADRAREERLREQNRPRRH